MAPRLLPPPTDIVQVNSFSDGDPTHRPKDPAYVPSDPDRYLRKLATMWMANNGGGARPGEWRYILCVFDFSCVMIFRFFRLI